MNFMPQQIDDCLARWFDYKTTEIYCQLANQLNAKPHIRTMRLYAITQAGCLEFLSRTDTQKWLAWQLEPRVALCLLNPNFGQILVEGEVILKTKKTHPNDIEDYWHLIPKGVQTIYTEIEVKEIPESFGVISVKPVLWEVLELSTTNYLASSRTLYQLNKDSWVEEKIKVTS